MAGGVQPPARRPHLDMEPDRVTSIGTFVLTFMSKPSGIFTRLPVELQAHGRNWKKALKPSLPSFFFFQSDRSRDLRYVVDYRIGDYGRIIDYGRTGPQARVHDHEDPLSEVVGKLPGPRVPARRGGSGDPLRGFHYKPVFHVPIEEMGLDETLKRSYFVFSPRGRRKDMHQ
jgi:hypothetical protein